MRRIGQRMSPEERAQWWKERNDRAENYATGLYGAIVRQVNAKKAYWRRFVWCKKLMKAVAAGVEHHMKIAKLMVKEKDKEERG